jgi:hypothetical protein
MLHPDNEIQEQTPNIAMILGSLAITTVQALIVGTFPSMRHSISKEFGENAMMAFVTVPGGAMLGFGVLKSILTSHKYEKLQQQRNAPAHEEMICHNFDHDQAHEIADQGLHHLMS